jgi:hypothetical protein
VSALSLLPRFVWGEFDAENQPLVFAPVATLMPYDTLEEVRMVEFVICTFLTGSFFQAIELANGTRYGLGASVFGPSQDLCVKVAKQLECGMVSVNDFGVFYVSGWFVLPRAVDLVFSLSSSSRRNCILCLRFLLTLYLARIYLLEELRPADTGVSVRTQLSAVDPISVPYRWTGGSPCSNERESHHGRPLAGVGADWHPQSPGLPDTLPGLELVRSVLPPSSCAFVLTNYRREFVSGLVSFLYADGWRRRIAGVVRLVQAIRK